ncbi:hypothetical protein HHI36_007714 [Cryptolaemus montrouzieri]|uniref:Fibronectin type-III domain-containing protein n=1 Tax=Cryptolaemus montrouzieri TaxID=559131 RepID=A0ABD2MQD0_9CUCU
MIPLVLIPFVCMLLMYIFCLFEDEELRPPCGLHVLGFKGCQVQIAWNPMVFDDTLDKHIIINLWNYKTSREYVVDPDTVSAMISFLPKTKNFVTVSVRTSTKCGKPSDVFIFQAPAQVIPKPRNLNAHQLGNSSVLLIWEKPEISAGALRGYSIHYYDQRGRRRSLTTKSNQCEIRHLISGLIQGIPYFFSVKTISVAGISEPITEEIILKPHVSSKPDMPTFEHEIVETDLFDLDLEEPCSSSEILTFIDENNTTKKKALKVTWLPDLKGNPGDRFSVQYRKKGESIFRCSGVEEERNFILLTTFHDNDYEVYVTSVDGSFSNDSRIQDIRFL